MLFLRRTLIQLIFVASFASLINCFDFFEDSDSSEFDDFNVQTSFISSGFTNSQSFTCARVKELLKTGTSAGDLAPDDIGVVATLGDAIATGLGLYPAPNIEFRGAVFTTGGDANIDGLPTVSNIIAQFNPNVRGVSHGMGSPDQLPIHQLNLAENGAESDGMLYQAKELVRRLKIMDNDELSWSLESNWVMVFMTIGTEELCLKCDEPNGEMLRHALTALRKGIPKVLVVIVGPVHVSKNTALTYNLLKPRCPCLSKLSDRKLREIQKRWRDTFLTLENEFNSRDFPNFEVLALPLLEISSRFPEQLFIAEKPLLNRRGHAYAAKWLWNRLITGPKYNASGTYLSEESYYCPSLGCPYFRTSKNLHLCVTITLQEYNRLRATSPNPLYVTTMNPRVAAMQLHIEWYMIGIIFFSSLSVFIWGTVFYCHGLKQTKGRFEVIQGV